MIIYELVKQYGRKAFFTDSNHDALIPLCESKDLFHIHKEIYYIPEYSPLLKCNVCPYSGDIVEELSKYYNMMIIPQGAACSNMLHMSTQVPARSKYLMNIDEPFLVMGYIQFMPAVVPIYENLSYIENMVIQALYYEGNICEYVNEKYVKIAKKYLTNEGLSFILSEMTIPEWLRNSFSPDFYLTSKSSA